MLDPIVINELRYQNIEKDGETLISLKEFLRITSADLPLVFPISPIEAWTVHKYAYFLLCDALRSICFKIIIASDICHRCLPSSLCTYYVFVCVSVIFFECVYVCVCDYIQWCYKVLVIHAAGYKHMHISDQLLISFYLFHSVER